MDKILFMMMLHRTPQVRFQEGIKKIVIFPKNVNQIGKHFYILKKGDFDESKWMTSQLYFTATGNEDSIMMVIHGGTSAGEIYNDNILNQVFQQYV